MAKEDIRSYDVVRIMMRLLFDFQLFRLRGWGGGGGGEGGGKGVNLGIIGGGVPPGSR